LDKGVAGERHRRRAKSVQMQTLRINKDLTQANIILGHVGVPRSHADYYAIK
jgi:hypothetical protein